MKKLTVIGVAALILVAGCGGGGGGGNSAHEEPSSSLKTLPGFSAAEVTLDVPTGTYTAGWKVHTGFLTSEGVSSGSNTLPIQVLEEERQLVWAGTADGLMTLASIKEPGTTSFSLSPLTTAVALVVLTPMILPEYLANPSGIRSWLEARTEVQEFAAVIESKLAGNKGFAATDPEIRDVLSDTWQKALLALHPSVGSSKVSVTEQISSAAMADSLKKVGVSDQGVLTLQFINRQGRWVQAFVERRDAAHTVVQEVLIPGATLASLAPPALFEPSQANIQYPIQPYPTNSDVVLKVYGPGSPGTFPWNEVTRVIEPTLYTLLEHFIFPIFDIITGKDLFKKLLMPDYLRGMGKAAGFVALLQEVIVEGLKNKLTWIELIPKVVYRAWESMMAGDSILLNDALEGDTYEFLADSAAQTAAYFIPVVGQIYGALKISAAAIQIVGSAMTILNSSWVDEYPVRNLPPAVELTAEPVAGTQNAFKFKATTGYPVISFDWDFGDGTSRVSEKSGTLAVETKTYGEAKEYVVTVRATDADGAVGSATTTVKVKELKILTEALPDGLVGRPYQATLALDGADPNSVPQVSIASGSLPSGLGWTGLTLAGTPKTAGSYEFTVKVTSGFRSATKTLKILVGEFVITTPSVLPAIEGKTPYSVFFHAAGGQGPYSWSAYFGPFNALPQGLTFDPAKGELRGTPLESGKIDFKVTATDAMGAVCVKYFSLEVRRLITTLTFSIADYWQQNWNTDREVKPVVDLWVNGTAIATGVSLSAQFVNYDLLSQFPTLAHGGHVEIKVKVQSTGGWYSGEKLNYFTSLKLNFGILAYSNPPPLGWGSWQCTTKNIVLGPTSLQQGQEAVLWSADIEP